MRVKIIQPNKKMMLYQYAYGDYAGVNFENGEILVSGIEPASGREIEMFLSTRDVDIILGLRKTLDSRNAPRETFPAKQPGA